MPEDEACPAALDCPIFQELCLDGNCSADCTEANYYFDPDGGICPSSRPKICQSIVLTYDVCQEAFGSIYALTTSAFENEAEEDVTLFTLREPGFVAIYCWICIVFALIFIWCAYNQRIDPVAGSTQPLTAEKHRTTKAGADWTQTGHRAGPVGMTLYTLVMITAFGFQFLLGSLTIFYYIQQEAITWFKPVFEDEIQVLRVHEITWGAGFFFTLLLRWPFSVKALFLRRSSLDLASHVIITVPMTKAREGEKINGRMKTIKNIISKSAQSMNSIMRFVFSDVSLPADGEFTRTVCKVEVDPNGHRYFHFRLRRYIFDVETGVFVPGECLPGITVGDFINAKGGLTTDRATEEMAIVGRNIIHMKRPYFILTLIKEFSKTFYIYQVFMIWTWFPLWYYYMALVQTFIVSSGGLIISFFQYRNEKNLYRITNIKGTVSVIRDGNIITINQKDIVPGDVTVVQPGPIFADMVLVDGLSHIVVDESALTGEATPTAKFPLNSLESTSKYSYATHKKHTLSAGTSVIETDGQVLAVVLATGSHTSKGELLRDILSYQRHKFKFDTEVKIVIFILFLYSIVGFCLTVSLYKDDFVYEWFYGMFVVGTCLPPLLPTVFTVSVGISDERLARKRIACVNSEDILVAGKVKMAFFDKTGTLTKQGLDFMFASEGIERFDKSIGLKPDGYLSVAMATCHNLTTDSKGVLIGNSVDINVFSETMALMSDDGSSIELKNGSKVEVLKKFDFDHHRMTQSVVVEYGGKIVTFVKGSGESIKKLCNPKSIPDGFDTALAQCAREGIYQISYAMKEVKVPKNQIYNMSRDTVEFSLDFIGVVDFKNQLREDTAEVLSELEEGDVKSTMITGDNTLTGICIAKEAGLIKPYQTVIFGESAKSGIISWVDENNKTVPFPSFNKLESGEIVLAVTGEVWKAILDDSEMNPRQIAEHIRVFGRCTPNDKVSVVDCFVQDGITCCMVGDGGNDCGALKTAHVGIALSDAEASIVAPFTSLDKSISSVVEVLKEGRCALASALASYKYMIMYGQVESINQIANAYFSVTFHEWCWVFMDGVWMISMAFSLPLAYAEKRLSPKRPTSSLLGANTMSSILGVLILNFSFTCISLGLLMAQDWYDCRRWNSTDISNITLIGDNYEASVLFIVTGYQYISSAMAFNWGFSFRAAWWKNYVFVALCISYTIVHFIATLHPSTLSCVWRLNCTNDHVVPAVTDTAIPINNAFNTTVMPVAFRVKLVVIMIVNACATALWTYFIGSEKVRSIASSGSLSKAPVKEELNEDKIQHV
jgi:cation-transporting ATPase 13A3/4/5